MSEERDELDDLMDEVIAGWLAKKDLQMSDLEAGLIRILKEAARVEYDKFVNREYHELLHGTGGPRVPRGILT